MRTFWYITWERFSQNMRFLQNHKDDYGGSSKRKNSTSQGFPYWGVPTTSRKFAHPPWRKITPTKFLSPPLPLPTKQQFSSYNPIKTTFLAVAIASAPFCFNFILFWHTGHVNFYFDVQYSQEDVFSFKKGSNRQNHSSSGSLHPVKKFSPPSKISESPLHALPLFGKPWHVSYWCREKQTGDLNLNEEGERQSRIISYFLEGSWAYETSFHWEVTMHYVSSLNLSHWFFKVLEYLLTAYTFIVIPCLLFRIFFFSSY